MYASAAYNNDMQTPTTKKLYKVIANGAESAPLSKRTAETIARWLREGKTGRRKHAAPVEATVVAA